VKRWLLILLILIALAIGGYLFFSRSPPLSGEPVTLQWYTGVEKPAIIFVHGLGGDAHYTWGESNSFMELLRADPAFADYGITSVRYPSRILGHYPSLPQLASSFAKCLDESFDKNGQLVIIAHSLGGIIARQALVQSGWQYREHQIVTLITLASPFDGSKLPDFTEILSPFGISSRQMQALGVKSDVLMLCDNNWTNLVKQHGTRIRQFAASEGKPISGIYTVLESSATMGVPQDCVFHSIQDTHISIAKPTSLKEGIGKQVRDWLLLALNKWEYKARDYTFDQNVEIPAKGTVTIEAGATLHFRKGAKLLCKGHIEARGTKDAEITFDFDELSDIESGLLLRGQDVADSEFVYCQFRHGKGIGIQKPNPATASATADELWGERQTILTSQGNPYGGGVLLIGANKVTFRHCKFTENHASLGGAIGILGSKRIQINGCTFDKNNSSDGGGAIFAQSSEVYVGGKCVFKNNTTGVNDCSGLETHLTACGGALYIGYGTHCEVRDSEFSNNIASNAGGAIYIKYTNPRVLDAVTSNELCRIKFVANKSCDADGGAVRIDGDSRVHLVDLNFVDNYSGPKSGLSGPAFWDNSTSGADVTRVTWVRNDKPFTELYRSAPNFVPLTASPYELREELIQNENCYKKAEKRIIDTIVLHYISAAGWNDVLFRKQFADKLKEFESSPEAKLALEDRANAPFDWRLCKEILELYGWSSHYMIDRGGVIHHLVKDDDIAFHAGGSIMPEGDDRQNVNDFSIGIELISADPQTDETISQGQIPAFTEEQYKALIALLTDLSRKHGIPAKNIVGHNEIAGARAVQMGLRKDKKEDPGPKFDWQKVRKGVDASLNSKPASATVATEVQAN